MHRFPTSDLDSEAIIESLNVSESEGVEENKTAPGASKKIRWRRTHYKHEYCRGRGAKQRGEGPNLSIGTAGNMEGELPVTKPDFLYIGIARAGSTWLFEMLRQHPEIFVPPAKDVYFFDRYFDKGLEWYFSHFKHAGAAKAVGELSHDYYFSEKALKRIGETLPEVRLICCLREPVGRLVSGYVYNRTTALRSGVSLASYAAQGEIATQFEYYHHLKRYVDYFGRDRVLVLFFEDMVEAPETYMRTIYGFLGVDDTFVPPNLHERINPARDARAESLALFAYRVALLLRRLGLSNLVGRLKESKLLNRLLYKAPAEGLAEHPSPELIARLRRDHTRLESLLELPLPKSWYA
jgi:hypothetical protein